MVEGLVVVEGAHCCSLFISLCHVPSENSESASPTRLTSLLPGTHHQPFTMSTAVLTPEATPPEKKVLKQTDEYVRLLQHALTRLQATPPRLILSPATQPRRGAVAIIIHIIPPPGYSLPPQEQYECPTTLQDLFDQDWVNQPGCVAEVVYIQRETNPDASSYNPSSASVSGKHVAFPGGRREADDESERYTGESSPSLRQAERNVAFSGNIRSASHNLDIDVTRGAVRPLCYHYASPD